jgi:hypothetical protein
MNKDAVIHKNIFTNVLIDKDEIKDLPSLEKLYSIKTTDSVMVYNNDMLIWIVITNVTNKYLYGIIDTQITTKGVNYKFNDIVRLRRNNIIDITPTIFSTDGFRDKFDIWNKKFSKKLVGVVDYALLITFAYCTFQRYGNLDSLLDNILKSDEPRFEKLKQSIIEQK